MHFLQWFLKRELMAYGDKASEGSKMLRQIAYYGRQVSKMKLNLNRSDFRKIGSYV